MEQLPIPEGAGIRDEDVAGSAPLVRALVVQRLEMIWRACEPHIRVDLDDEGHPMSKPDPRFVEAGIRVTDRLANLYRLSHPQPGANDTDPAAVIDARELARQQVRELEERMGG